MYEQLAKAPFSRVELRHTFAADILTSFTKVAASVAYTACYFGSRAYLHTADKEENFGLDRFATCSESGYLHAVVVFLYMWPLYMRFMQNMRQQYDAVQRRKLESTKVHVAEAEYVPSDSTTDVVGDGSTSSSAPRQHLAPSSSSSSLSRRTLVNRKAKNGKYSAEDKDSGTEAKSPSGSPRALVCDTTVGNGRDAGTNDVLQLVDADADDDVDMSAVSSGDSNGQYEERSYGGGGGKSGEHHYIGRVRRGDSDDDGSDDDNDDDDDNGGGDEEQTVGAVHVNGGSSKKPTRQRMKIQSQMSLYRSVSESFIISKSRRRRAKRSVLEMLNRKYLPTWLLVWPYSYNAFKYFLSMLVVLFGAYPPHDPESLSYMVPYLCLCALSTAYSTYWDIANDWQLCQMTPPNYLLREPLYYGETEYFYYIVIVSNVIFRSFWTLGFTPYGKHSFLVSEFTCCVVCTYCD